MEYLFIIVPLAVIELILQVIALWDWYGRKNMHRRVLWLIVIILLSLAGPIIYFLGAPRDFEGPIDEPDVWL